MLSGCQCRWFFPQLSRTRAENILKGEVSECSYHSIMISSLDSRLIHMGVWVANRI